MTEPKPTDTLPPTDPLTPETDAANMADLADGMAAGETSDKQNIPHPLTIPNYRYLLLNRTFATLGSAFDTVPFMWWAVEKNASGALAASIGMVAAIATFAVAPWAGVIADKARKKPIMQLTYLIDVLLMVTAAALLILDTLTIWQAFMFTILGNVVGNLRMPAKDALVPAVIPKRMYQKGTAFSELILTIASLAAFPLAGAAVGLLGLGNGMLVGAGILILASLMLIPLKEPDTARASATLPMLASIAEGMRYILRSPFLVSLITIIALMNLVLAPMIVLMSTHINAMGGGATQLGLVMTATMIGQFSGLLLSNVVSVQRPLPIIFFSTVLIGIGVGGMAYASNFLLLYLGLGIIGFAAALINVQVSVLAQCVIVEEMRGRTSSVFATLNAALQPAIFAVIGVLLARVTPTQIFLWMGIALISSSLMWLTGSVRKSIAEAKLSMATG
jgi:MFS family permease